MPILNFDPNVNSTGIQEIDTSNAVLVEQSYSVNSDSSFTVTKTYSGFYPIEFTENLEPTYEYLNGTAEMHPVNTKGYNTQRRKIINSISELELSEI